MTAWWLTDDCLMTAWWLPDDCLMTDCWLPDDCLMTVWWCVRGGPETNKMTQTFLLNENYIDHQNSEFNEWMRIVFLWLFKNAFSIHKDHYCLVNHASQTREDEIFVLQGDWNTPTLSEQVLEKKVTSKKQYGVFPPLPLS